MQKQNSFPLCAVIGCGDWGKNLVRTLASLDALGAIVDRHESRAQELKEAHGAPILKFEEVLNDPNITACFIATAAATHVELAQKALDAGKHVFIEKPAAHSFQEAQNLYLDAQRRELYVMVGHLLLHHPVFQKVQEMIKEGMLGDINFITTRRQNFGKFFKDESVLWDLGPHDLSMILALFPKNQSLSLRKIQKSTLYARNNIADVVDATLFFERGVMAHMSLSRMSPVKEQTLTITGDKGILHFDDTKLWAEKLQFIPIELREENFQKIPVRLPTEFIQVSQEEPLKQECLAFLRSIQENKKPTSFEKALEVIKILESIEKTS